MDNLFAPKFTAELCLAILSPKDRSLYQSTFNYLLEQCCTPIEVKSHGEALIHSRNAKFAIIIMPDEDVDLIKKLKAPDGLNNQTSVVVISSEDKVTASHQEMLDNKLVQQVVQMTSDSCKFQSDLLAAVKQQLWVDRHADNNMCTLNTTSPETQPHGNNHYQMPVLPEIPGVISLPRQPGFLPGYMQGPTGQFPIMPLQPYTLYPPMPVSYPNLPQSHMQPTFTPQYMMPRVVSFRNQHDEAFLSLLGQSSRIKPDPSQGQAKTGTTTGSTIDDSNSPMKNKDPASTKPLPAIKKFLEALGPVETEKIAEKDLKEQENKETKEKSESDEPPAKRLRGNTPLKDNTEKSSLQSPNETAKGDVEHEGEKYPLPVSQGLPYFVSLDKEMERMAFDPAVKPSDRHNAKERHRRVRITKAADFFRDSVPCMNANMDKATVFHLTVYYLTYIRNSLQQEDPSLLSNLHKSYRQEWEKYFNMQQMLDEPCM